MPTFWTRTARSTPRSLRTPSTLAPIPTCGRCVPRSRPSPRSRSSLQQLLPGSCGAGGATAKIAGIGKHLGGAFVGSSIRKIFLKCRFSKAAVFLSRRDENFSAYFADMQENIDDIFKKTEICHSDNSKTNRRYKHEKIGLYRLFLVRNKGFEPRIPALGGRCSVQLSYWHICIFIRFCDHGG